MILPDTNVISELLKPACDPSVLAWAREQGQSTMFLAATVQAELLLGVALLPQGKRRSDLAENLSGFFTRFFGERHLPFDSRAAAAFSTIVADARQRGIAIATMDGRIAAIGKVNGLTVATRDTAPFQAAGVGLINPWLTSV